MGLQILLGCDIYNTQKAWYFKRNKQYRTTCSLRNFLQIYTEPLRTIPHHGAIFLSDYIVGPQMKRFGQKYINYGVHHVYGFMEWDKNWSMHWGKDHEDLDYDIRNPNQTSWCCTGCCWSQFTSMEMYSPTKWQVQTIFIRI